MTCFGMSLDNDGYDPVSNLRWVAARYQGGGSGYAALRTPYGSGFSTFFNSYSFAVPNSDKGSAQYSLEALIYTGATPGSITICQYFLGGNSDKALTLQSGVPTFSIYDGSTKTVSAGAALAGGRVYHLCGVSDGAGHLYIYVNGVLAGTNSSIGTPQTYIATLQIGNSSGGGDGTAILYAATAPTVGWSAQEVAWRYLNPYGHLAFFVDTDPAELVGAVTGGTAYVLSAASGRFTFVGNPAQLVANRILSPLAGSFGLTGKSAALVANRVLSPASGDFALSGRSANLIANRLLGAGAGQFKLTGEGATLLAARRLNAGFGSFVLTGQPVAMSAARKLVAGAGAFALTGRAAQLQAALKLSPGAGSFGLTGQPVNLVYTPAGPQHYVLLVGAGGFSLSGRPASLVSNRKLSAARGTFGFTGNQAQLMAARRLAAGTGAFAFSGRAAVLQAALALSAGTAAFHFTGRSANLVYTPPGAQAYTLTAGAGFFSLMGQPVNMTYTLPPVNRSGFVIHLQRNPTVGWREF